MTLLRPWPSLVVAACAGVTISLWAQPPDGAPQLKILSPTDDVYLTGSTLLSAGVTPTDAVTGLTFFVDGRQVCALTKPPFECEWNAGATIAAHQVRAVATIQGGTRIVQTVRTKSVGYVERVDVDVVQVTVTVSDASGKFIPNIPRSAFHVTEDGRSQAITYFTSEDVPLDLVAAIDISGSMGPAMPKVKAAVKEFLGNIPSQDQVTLLGFNDSIFTLTRRATERADRMKAVDRLAPWGSTALYDVLLRGVEMLGRQPGRKALIVFTDGEDQGSHSTIGDVERRLESTDVSLYMIAQGRGVTAAPLRRIMERLCVPTGGRALFTDSIDELRAAFADLLDELSNQYLLGYQSTNSRRDDAWRKIEVDVDGHDEVRARQGYRALAGK